jgi:hypothetical protein
MKKYFTLYMLRIVALTAGLAGALGSLSFVLHTGRNNDSVLLVLLFVAWVLSPFIALFVANLVSMRWPAFTRVILYCLIIFLTVGSLLSYSGTLRLPGKKPAFVFLVVPLLSWIIIAIVIPITISVSHRLSGRSENA